MGLVVLSLIVVAGVMAAMAVGVIFSGRCLRGSCGGADVLGPDGEPLTCATCPNRLRAATARDETPAADLAVHGS